MKLAKDLKHPLVAAIEGCKYLRSILEVFSPRTPDRIGR